MKERREFDGTDGCLCAFGFLVWIGARAYRTCRGIKEGKEGRKIGRQFGEEKWRLGGEFDCPPRFVLSLSGTLRFFGFLFLGDMYEMG